MSALGRSPGVLAFGLLHTVAATVGQTFLISLFLPGIKAGFALGDAEVALLFTVTTLASAVALWIIGPWLDRADVIRYSLSCGALLAIAAGVIAGAREWVLLVLGFFCLRLAGNGLLTHVALTATARYFAADRGKALSIVLLGSSVGEAALPAALIALTALIGWRPTLALTGAFALALVIAAAAAVRKNAAFRRASGEVKESSPATRRATPATPHGDSRTYFRLTALLFIGMPMVVTATIFHQALVAEVKGVSLQWFAISFIAFVFARVVSSMVAGPIIDRVGSTDLFSFHLLPLAAGTVALIAVDSAWVVPLYWMCAGMSSGLGTVLHMTVIAERIAPSKLARARSIVAAAGIVASAAGPSLYGLGLVLGARIPTILWGSVTVLLVATALGLLAQRASARPRCGHEW